MKIEGKEIVFEEIIISHKIGVDQPQIATVKVVIDRIKVTFEVGYYENRTIIDKILSPFEKPLTEVQFL